jgi:hypothetical protein
LKGSKCESANNFRDEPRNLSSYITECRSSEKSKIILERHQHIEQKYLLYYVHEITWKYPREKKRYSGFSDRGVDSRDTIVTASGRPMDSVMWDARREKNQTHEGETHHTTFAQEPRL